MFFKRLVGYLDITAMFRKGNPENEDGLDSGSKINLRMMHGINRISILMFLFCVAVMVWRYLIK